MKHLLPGLCCIFVLIGCSNTEYKPRVICHNANCVEPANPKDDDTPEALQASLALVDDADRPLIDGVEIDTFWFGEESRCLFAHDLDNKDSRYDVSQATDAINAYLSGRAMRNAPLTRTAPEFTVLVELKGHVGTSKGDKHSKEQRESHVACAVGIAQVLGDSARMGGYPIEVIFTSFDSALLTTLSQNAEYKTLRAGTDVKARLGVLAGIPAPLDSQTEGIDAYPETLGVDFVSAHPHWTRHAALKAYASRQWSLGLWMFSIVPETLDAIEQYEPEYITTSEARALTRWLSR